MENYDVEKDFRVNEVRGIINERTDGEIVELITDFIFEN
jgi:hypothetical protein